MTRTIKHPRIMRCGYAPLPGLPIHSKSGTLGVMLSQRLRDLDDRVLQMDRREAELRTGPGWRKHAARWRYLAAVAALFIGLALFGDLFREGSYAGLILLGASFAFQAGMLKAEDDRLNRRGPLERLRPPGL
jgi:hypothetical protein